MRLGTKLEDFWKSLSTALDPNSDASDFVDNTPGIKDLLTERINPSLGCPQCRYYMLNKRIIGIKSQIQHVSLISKLVTALEQNPETVPINLAAEIEKVWPPEIVDIQQAKAAFLASKKLGIRPSL
jgi:hypothetical protein